MRFSWTIKTCSNQGLYSNLKWYIVQITSATEEKEGIQNSQQGSCCPQDDSRAPDDGGKIRWGCDIRRDLWRPFPRHYNEINMNTTDRLVDEPMAANRHCWSYPTAETGNSEANGNRYRAEKKYETSKRTDRNEEVVTQCQNYQLKLS